MDTGREAENAPLVGDHRQSSRVGIGIALIVLGALFFMDRLGGEPGRGGEPLFPRGGARGWGCTRRSRGCVPVLLIVAGLAQLASSVGDTVVTDKLGHEVRTRRGRSFPGFWWLAVGVIMLLDQNRWLTLDRSWPLFIIAGGLSMLLTRRGQTRGG